MASASSLPRGTCLLTVTFRLFASLSTCVSSGPAGAVVPLCVCVCVFVRACVRVAACPDNNLN